MVWLGENSPHWNEYLFFLQKKANAILLTDMSIEKVAYMNSGLDLIPAAGTDLEQLEDNASCLAQVFGACRAEKNEKQAKYLVRDVFKRIITLEGLTDVITDMDKEVFKMSCGMKPEQATGQSEPASQ